MIIARTPLRISFFGGGTDIPRVYREIEGCVFSAAIEKYIYINVNKKWPTSELSVTAKYTILEQEIHPRYLKHPIMRTVLLNQNLNGLDIAISSDIPGGTGLGSSSAFTVGFLLATNALKGIEVSKYQLAASACEIEIDFLGEPIGKQDAFASAFGGINRFDFQKSGEVNVTSCLLSNKEVEKMEKSLYLIRVGGYRKTSDLLMNQLLELESQKHHLSTYEKIADQAKWASKLREFSAKEFGAVLDDAWSLKKSLSASITSTEIEELILLGKRNGATGAKLLGAGGSGFVLFIVPEEFSDKFMAIMENSKIIRPKLDQEGAMKIYP